jgi:hypothetical protein
MKSIPGAPISFTILLLLFYFFFDVDLDVVPDQGGLGNSKVAVSIANLSPLSKRPHALPVSFFYLYFNIY